MPKVDRELCREAAAECAELARVTIDPEIRRTLLTRAQEWLKLAYSPDVEFERLLTEFNRQQMDFSGIRPPARMQRQPMQQQQKKAEPDDK